MVTPPAASATTSAKAHFPNGTSVELEVVSDPESRAQGLMYRDRLRPGTGMLFVFPTDDVYAFWMKNTYIALDMIWIAANGTIVDIKHGVPPCQADPCPSYPPSGEARYVLELAAGDAKRYGLAPGASIRLENVRAELAR